jgi:CopG family transcriptional regulator, nickel-responsive regulator
MNIISFSIPKHLLEKIDDHIHTQGFANRSEIIRQALRDYLSENRNLDDLEGEITATIALVYKREAKRDQIIDLQHNFKASILTFLHTHVETGFCIEVIVVKGRAETVKALIQALKANKQISEVKATII